MEMKHLFSITPKDEKGGEVAEVFLAEKQALDAGLLGVRRWLWQRRTLTSASDQLVVLQCSEGVVTDTLVVWHLTRDVSVRWRWRQQSAVEA
jgi:hypothetical protein